MSIVDGAQLRRLREQRGWEQQQLALAAGVNPSVISRLERELQEDVKLSVMVAIAGALEVTLDSLLRHSEPLPSASELVPELQAAFAQLAQQPETIQRQAAGILQGYLSSL